ncbi:MAG: inosose dehydratase [Streptomycetaceae bacterium]|nr:MAG: inosose dehydratase [Streptomycetaceae bacterium]
MDLNKQLAGAPISWGVCEANGWGYQIEADQVLTEMRECGITATELGPDGYLPQDAKELARVLDGHGLDLCGAFVPIVLHKKDRLKASYERARRQAEVLAALNAGNFVLATPAEDGDYDSRDLMDAQAKAVFSESLPMITEIAKEFGLQMVLHPHAGTMFETPNDLDFLLNETDINLCLDTGHIVVGGGNPLDIAKRAGSRVKHVHLKDCDAAAAARIQNRTSTYSTEVKNGMYKPLGQGDAQISEVIRFLDGINYEGKLVLEQDVMLDQAPAMGSGPIDAVRESINFLSSLINA